MIEAVREHLRSVICVVGVYVRVQHSYNKWAAAAGLPRLDIKPVGRDEELNPLTGYYYSNTIFFFFPMYTNPHLL